MKLLNVDEEIATPLNRSETPDESATQFESAALGDELTAPLNRSEEGRPEREQLSFARGRGGLVRVGAMLGVGFLSFAVGAILGRFPNQQTAAAKSSPHDLVQHSGQLQRQLLQHTVDKCCQRTAQRRLGLAKAVADNVISFDATCETEMRGTLEQLKERMSEEFEKNLTAAEAATASAEAKLGIAKAKLKSKDQRLNEEREILDKEKQVAQQSKSAVEERLEHANKDKSMLEASLGEAQTNLTKWTKKLHGVQQQRSSLDQKLAEVEKKLHEEQKAYADMEGSAEEKVEQAEAKAASLEIVLDQDRDRLEREQNVSSSLERRNAEDLQQRQDNREELLTITDKQVTAQELRDSLMSATEDNKMLAEQLAAEQKRIREKNKRFIKEEDKYRAELKMSKDLLVDKLLAEERGQRLKRRLALAEEKISLLEQKLKQEEHWSRNNISAVQKRMDFAAGISQQMGDQLQAEQQGRKKAEKARREAEEQLRNCSNVSSDLKNQVKEHQGREQHLLHVGHASKANVTYMTKQLALTEEQLHKALDLNIDLERQAKDDTKKEHHLLREGKILETNNTDLGDQLAHMQENKHALDHMVNELLGQKSQLAKKKAAEEQRLVNMQKNVSVLEKELQEEALQRKGAQKDKKASQAGEEALQQRLSALEKTRAEADRQRIVAEEEQIAQHKIAQQKASAAQANQDALQKRVSALELRFADMQKQKSVAEAELEQQKKQTRDAQKKIDALSEKMRLGKRNISSVEAQLKEETKQVANDASLLAAEEAHQVARTKELSQEIEKVQLREQRENNKSRQESSAARAEAKKSFSEMKAAEEQLLDVMRHNVSSLAAQLEKTRQQVDMSQSVRQQALEKLNVAQQSLAQERKRSFDLEKTVQQAQFKWDPALPSRAISASSYAFVMMAVDVDNNPEYISGVLAMAHMLRQLSEYPLLLLTNLEDLGGGVKVDALSALDVQILPLKHVPLPNSQSSLEHKRWQVAWQKLQIWRLTQFKKLIWLDSDALLYRSIDYLFESPWMKAQRDDWECKLDQKSVCSGIMLVFPNETDYNGMLEYANSPKADFAKGDQGIIDQYFRETHRHIGLLLDLEAAFGQCIGTASSPYVYGDGSSVKGTWSMPTFVHKSGGWSLHDADYFNVCFQPNVTQQLYEVAWEKINVCHYHSLGRRWRRHFCVATAMLAIHTPMVDSYCSEDCWLRGETPAKAPLGLACGPLRSKISDIMYRAKTPGQPYAETVSR